MKFQDSLHVLVDPPDRRELGASRQPITTKTPVAILAMRIALRGQTPRGQRSLGDELVQSAMPWSMSDQTTAFSPP